MRQNSKNWTAVAHHDLPVAVHVGWSDSDGRFMVDTRMRAFNISFTSLVLFVFIRFVGSGILERHPKPSMLFL